MDTPLDWVPVPGECLVVNRATRSVVSEFATVTGAAQWIDDTLDYQERMGLPAGDFEIVRQVASPNGRDSRR